MRSCTESCDSHGKSCTASRGTSNLARVSCRISTSCALEFRADFEPRNRATLPDFNAKPKASTVTLGRASYTMPITPKGTRTCFISMPLSMRRPWRTSPTGSERPATWRRPPAIPSMRSALKAKRSSRDSLMPRSRPAFKSASLAARILSVCATRLSAAASKISFFCGVVSRATAGVTSLAFAALSSTSARS